MDSSTVRASKNGLGFHISIHLTFISIYHWSHNKVYPFNLQIYTFNNQIFTLKLQIYTFNNQIFTLKLQIYTFNNQIFTFKLQIYTFNNHRSVKTNTFNLSDIHLLLPYIRLNFQNYINTDYNMVSFTAFLSDVNLITVSYPKKHIVITNNLQACM